MQSKHFLHLGMHSTYIAYLGTPDCTSMFIIVFSIIIKFFLHDCIPYVLVHVLVLLSSSISFAFDHHF
jgi:hypothetical protein